ncbi:MAG: hypothetical protein ACHQ51_15385 [Elusimicrobiota bacterium]
MTEAEFAREWTAFGGISLALMGAALSAGARGYADDFLSWQRQWSSAVGAPEPASRGNDALIRVYRLLGVGGIVIGAALAAAAASGRAPASRVGASDARIMGICLTVLGFGFAMLKLGRDSRRSPRFLEPDPSASARRRAIDELAAEMSVWTLCALWTGFGLHLFWEATR